MIGQRGAWQSRSFLALVDHLSSFGEPQRRELAKLHDTPGDDPRTIAMAWCMNPERFRAAVSEHVRSAQLRYLVEDLVLDHDLPVRIDWAERNLLKKLVQVGLIRPLATRGRGMPRHVSIPGAIAAIMAPTVSSVRPSAPILLGKMSKEELLPLAKLYGVQDGPIIAMILELREALEDVASLDVILDGLPEPEWLGGAMMAIELGGMCYWQEVFGTGVEEPSQNIVPLMRDFERRQEQDIAQTLLGLGVIFRVDLPDTEHTMLAIPEELWPHLWGLGRGWLMEWVSHTFATLQENGARRMRRTPIGPSFQQQMKWLALEVSSQTVHYPPTTQERARLAKTSGLTPDACLHLIGMGYELELLDAREDNVLILPPALEILDRPRSSFSRLAMLNWCVGMLGAPSEELLAPAIGLDEEWRQIALELDLDAYDAMFPAWMDGEGLDSQMTGTGYLRSLAVSTPEMLLFEIGVVNSYVWSLKILWLDLLSLLEDGRWYPLGLLQELLQLVAALALFDRLKLVLDNPGLSHYLPVQRASFLSDPSHTSAFDAWCEEVLREVFTPLGVAVIEDDMVLLMTRELRVPTPAGIEESDRVALLREALGQPNLEFTITDDFEQPRFTIAGGGEEDASGDSVAISRALEELLTLVEGRKIKRFDGEHLELG